LLTVIRELVEQEVRSAMQALLGSFSTAKPAKNERRRRRRRRGPGRPPGSKNKKAWGLMARPTNPGRSWRPASRENFTVASGSAAWRTNRPQALRGGGDWGEARTEARMEEENNLRRGRPSSPSPWPRSPSPRRSTLDDGLLRHVLMVGTVVAMLVLLVAVVPSQSLGGWRWRRWWSSPPSRRSPPSTRYVARVVGGGRGGERARRDGRDADPRRTFASLVAGPTCVRGMPDDRQPGEKQPW